MARYKLIGYEVEGKDANERTVSLSEQTREPAQTVVYETDDHQEANAILQAGGFFRDRDNFVTVTRVVDASNPVPIASPMPQKGN